MADGHYSAIIVNIIIWGNLNYWMTVLGKREILKAIKELKEK